MLPRVRITELLAEVHGWTGFAERFVHLRTGAVPEDPVALMTAVLADATNLALWGEGDTSSSDGQVFRAGGHGEARADHNAHYGSEPGIKFYTHVSDRFAPFYTKVIAANASEAPHVLDGLLHHESSLVIREHYTDTGGATEHVFGLCHLLGFRFAPTSAIWPTADFMSLTITQTTAPLIL